MRKLILIIGIILLIACGIMIRSWHISPSNLSGVESSIKIYNHESDSIFDRINSIADNVSSNHQYSRTYPNIYDCTQFSRDLIRELNESGIKAKCIFGVVYKTKLHTWVLASVDYDGYYIQIPIEATAGQIIGYEDYINNYRKLSEGKCL